MLTANGNEIKIDAAALLMGQNKVSKPQLRQRVALSKDYTSVDSGEQQQLTRF